MPIFHFITKHLKLNIILVILIFLGFFLLTSCTDQSSLQQNGSGTTAATIETQDISADDKVRTEMFNELPAKNPDQESTYKIPGEPNDPAVEVFEGKDKVTSPQAETELDKELASLSQAYNPIYRINRGDTLEISIPFEPDSRQLVNVRPDGTLGYLYGVEVEAAGLTYPELKTKIEEELEKYYYQPKVDINGKTFSGSQIYIMGPIKSPGSHVIQNNTKLLDCLSIAGVLSQIPGANLLSYNNSQTNDVVDLKNSYIMREGKILPIDFERLLLKREMKFNIYVQANDFLFFPSSYLSDISESVYIIGAVTSPRIYQYTTDTSFMSAIASAGGVDKYRADRNHIAIIRKNADKLITISYNKIINGEQPDIALEDKDIIYVPERGLYSASRWTTTIIGEIIAPLQAIVQASSASKAVNMQDWNPTSDFGPTDVWMQE